MKMKVNRKVTSLKRLGLEDDSFVDASPEERISFMWELTKEIWSLRGDANVKRRLQRNIANLIKQES